MLIFQQVSIAIKGKNYKGWSYNYWQLKRLMKNYLELWAVLISISISSCALCCALFLWVEQSDVLIHLNFS